MLTYLQIIAGIWIVFMILFFIPALRDGIPVERRSSRYIRWSFMVALAVVILAIVLATYEPDALVLRVIPGSPLAGMTGIVITLAGLGFSAWARYHLGRYWSSMVMIKVGHQLIRTGPYRIVRNPIYTGILIAFVGAAIAIGELLAFVALVIGFASIWVKIKAEEEILLEKFGEEYLQYKRDVRAAIIPWVV
ncbi:MAG: isoprenylcysteine carboxylmethyltransferase family protein [Methanoregula sp.]|jgi:protein-S-isoprenylcysteine O-methyltransferase Ste14|uniref:methyltransferase family protein n=1 Tax=Methanoregula sp. TaxID=2052170 RepID=UPI003C23F3A6